MKKLFGPRLIRISEIYRHLANAPGEDWVFFEGLTGELAFYIVFNRGVVSTP